jgi:hypothetical protein
MLHPVAWLAVLVLLGNDWWGKQAYPGWFTGKLSDFAGLVVAPLALTSALALALHALAALGAPIDPSLRRWRITTAIAAVAAVFIATKTSGAAASSVAAALRLLGGHPRIVCDPTDLLALPALWLPWWVTAAELRLVPRGRVHALLRRRHLAVGFADSLAAGAEAGLLDRLQVAVQAARSATGEVARTQSVIAINESLRALASTGPQRSR